MLNSSRQLFGYTKDDLAVETLTLDNGILSCDIITFGAALRSLRVPDRSGIKRDVVLGYDTLEEYESHPGYLGAVVGRVFPWWFQSFIVCFLVNWKLSTRLNRISMCLCISMAQNRELSICVIH